MVNVTYDECEPGFIQSSSRVDEFLSPTAGSILTPENPDVVYSPGDIAWVLASTALVWIMIPGLGFFYSGLLR